jgi:hypothetical protein
VSFACRSDTSSLAETSGPGAVAAAAEPGAAVILATVAALYDNMLFMNKFFNLLEDFSCIDVRRRLYLVNSNADQ